MGKEASDTYGVILKICKDYELLRKYNLEDSRMSELMSFIRMKPFPTRAEMAPHAYSPAAQEPLAVAQEEKEAFRDEVRPRPAEEEASGGQDVARHA